MFTRSRKEMALIANIQKMRSQRMGMNHTIIPGGGLSEPRAIELASILGRRFQ
jgi:hypothetical protein